MEVIMELKEAIKNRRSIRKFDSKKIDNNIIEEILYYGSLAPSGKNRQPWRFVVIQEDAKLKREIADIMIKKAEEKVKRRRKCWLYNFYCKNHKRSTSIYCSF